MTNMTLISCIVFTAVLATPYAGHFPSLPVVDAIQPYDYLKIYNDQKRNHHRAFPKRRHVETPVANEDDVQELYITQKLDHFDPLSTDTYQQRYFVSYRYNSADDGRRDACRGKNATSRSTSLKGTTIINLLCVGGEGPGFDKSVLVDSVHCSGDMLELASKIAKLTKNADDSTAGSNTVSINLYALEHRYYGKSYPTFDDTDGSNQTSPVTTKHLKYLSSRQALEDLAHFIRTMNDETLTSGATGSDCDDYSVEEGEVLWVTFGGSYPGYMSLNARYKYPHLVHASVSSSAPLQLEVDFPGYKARQGWDLKYKKVGGSKECYRIVKTGHDQAVALLSMSDKNTTTNQTGAEMLARKFGVCNPESALLEPRNAQLLLGDGLINIPAQSNDPSCSDDTLCNIAGLCEYIEKEFEESSKTSSKYRQRWYVNGNVEDPATMSELDVLAKVAKHQRSSERRRLSTHDQKIDEVAIDDVDDDDDDCMEVDFQAMLAEWNKTTVEPFGWRSWLWQTCTEVGFYQTCLENTDCPFATNYHTVDMDLEICNSVFGFTPSQVYENVQATLDHYGGLNIYEASRVLSVNGNVDPWSVLALQTSPKYGLPVAWADGQSHHFWTHPVKDTDDPEIVEVRNYIYSVVLDWLGLASDEYVSASTSSNLPKNHLKEKDSVDDQKASMLRRRR